MKTIANAERKIRENKINEILQTYKIYKLRLRRKTDLNISTIECYEIYVKKIESCINKLKYPYDMTFTNEFLNKKFYWWEGLYCDSHYYRLRRDSGIEFLRLFEDQ